MKKVIFLMIAAYSAWCTIGGLAAADQMVKVNEATTAAIKAATE